MNTAIDRIKGYCCEVTQEQWDELVRVADEVGVKVYNSSWFTCKVKMVVSVHASNNDIVKDYINVQNKPVIPFPDFLAKLKGEDKWQPKAGEMVEVSQSGHKWSEMEYVAPHNDGHVVCRQLNYAYVWFKHIRPIRPTITRTEAERLLNKRIID
jgi:hypothetical protein